MTKENIIRKLSTSSYCCFCFEEVSHEKLAGFKSFQLVNYFPELDFPIHTDCWKNNWREVEKNCDDKWNDDDFPLHFYSLEYYQKLSKGEEKSSLLELLKSFKKTIL